MITKKPELTPFEKTLEARTKGLPKPPAKPPKFSDVLAARAKRPRPQPVAPKINWPKPRPEQPDFDPDGFIPNDRVKFEGGFY